VRTWLLDQPRWKRAVVLGTTFGAFMTLYMGLTQDVSWVAAVLGGVVAGALFGPIMSRTMFPQEPELRRVVGAARAAGRRQVSRATWRGPVPGDPDVRAAASAVIAYQLPILERQRRWAPFFYLFMIFVAGALALTGSPWYWAAAAFFGAVLVVQLVLPGHLRRRAELLDGWRPED
jgi:hypothetical protein